MKKNLLLLLVLASSVSFAQNLKISQLPVANIPLGGTELVPVVQDGVTKQTTVSAIGNTFTGGGFVTGTGSANQIAFWNSSGTIIGNANLLSTAYSLEVQDGTNLNTYVGFATGNGTTSGGDNIAFGNRTLSSITSGNDNVALGTLTLPSNTIGSYNVAINTSMQHNTSGSYNIAIGNAALTDNVTGSYNIAIGYLAGQSMPNNINNTIVLGENAEAASSNEFVIVPSISHYNLAGVDYMLPSAQGAASTVLTNDGSGNLSWTSPGSGSSLTANYIGYGSSGNTLTGSGAMVFYPANSINGNQFLVYSNDLSQIVFGAAIYGATGTAPATILLNAPNIITNGVMYHYPSAQGAASTVLTNDGSGNLTWAAASGTVTSFSSGNLSPLFTTSVATATTTPSLSFSLTSTSAHKFFGNFTAGTAAPSFSSPLLASADFANQGVTNMVLHGNAGGNPSWGTINLTSDVTGNLPIANGGTGQTTANAALNALLPSQSSNSGKFLTTDGTNSSWASAGSSSGWQLSGNSGTTYGTSFIGTTDDKCLMFKINSTESGFIEDASCSASTAFGYQALVNNSTTGGDHNCAFGYQADYSYNRYLSYNNNAFGYQANYTNGGVRDNAFGYHALYGNTQSDNDAFGDNALANNQGFDNCAMGTGALSSNTSGSNNVAVGFVNFSSIQATGSDLIAIGTGIDVNTDGWSNSIGLGNGNNFHITGSNQFTVDPTITNWVIGGVPYTIPTSQGAASTVLTNDGSGNLSWTSGGGGGGTPSLSSTYVGYGDGSNLMTGSVELTFDPSSNAFKVGTSSENTLAVYYGSGSTPHTVQMGDVSGLSNGSLFTVSDNTQTASWNKPQFNINNVPYQWTGTQGSPSTVLANDGSGNLSWQTATYGGTPSLSSTYIGYGNASGLLTGDFTLAREYDGTNYYGVSVDDGSFVGNIFIGGYGNLGYYPAGIALAGNIGCYQDIGIGAGVLSQITSGASDNVGLGHFALHGNITGTDNTAIGFSSLTSNSSGSFNVAIGSLNLQSNQYTGNNLIAIGYNINTSGDGYTNSIGIGNGNDFQITNSNQFTVDPVITNWVMGGVNYVIPTAQATAPGQTLINDGSGNLSWASPNAIVASNDLPSQTGSISNILSSSYTNPDGVNPHTYRIGVYINTTTETSANLQVHIDYVDENGNTRTITLFNCESGTSNNFSHAANTLFSAIPTDIRVGAGQSITISTTLISGSIDYDTGATIEFLN